MPLFVTYILHHGSISFLVTIATAASICCGWHNILYCVCVFLVCVCCVALLAGQRLTVHGGRNAVVVAPFGGGLNGEIERRAFLVSKDGALGGGVRRKDT